ncbi:MAG: DUF3108 domain-containing protein [bacterium]|nr:DUF3108 domain-containing protein [bacterium]
MNYQSHAFKSVVFLGVVSVVFALYGFTYTTDNAQSVKEEFVYRKYAISAFTFNEKLNFRIHYGIINAASVSMEIAPALEEQYDRQCYHIKAEGKTLKSFDWAYKVRDRFDSYVDAEAVAPIKFTKSIQEDNYLDNDLVAFKHGKKKLYGAKGVLDMPQYTQDVISAVYYIRNIDFSNAKKGDKYPLDVYLDNKIYNLGFKFDGRETLKTDIGTVRCLKFVPTLVVDRVFKDKEDMTIWVSDDDNKIPVRVKANIAVGSIKVDITSFSGLKNEFKALIKK